MAELPTGRALIITLFILCVLGLNIFVVLNLQECESAENLSLGRPYSSSSSSPRQFITSDLSPKPTVPMSLVVTCQEEDLWALPMVTESLANQTVFPHETLFIMNLSPSNMEGHLFTRLNFDPAFLSQRTLEKESANREIVNQTRDLKVAKSYVINQMMNLEDSLREIPNLNIHFRAGQHFGGQNRVYGAKMARNDSHLVSFWDCDDYLHPQRTEYVWKAFQLEPRLEAMVHGFQEIHMVEWDHKFNVFRQLGPYMKDDQSFFHSFEKIHSLLPIERFSVYENGEPPQDARDTWWYPRYMEGLESPEPFARGGHNGWVTLKPDVLKRIPYPEGLRLAQDSLYNWRLLRNKVFFNFLPLRLGAYVRDAVPYR